MIYQGDKFNLSFLAERGAGETAFFSKKGVSPAKIPQKGFPRKYRISLCLCARARKGQCAKTKNLGGACAHAPPATDISVIVRSTLDSEKLSFNGSYLLFLTHIFCTSLYSVSNAIRKNFSFLFTSSAYVSPRCRRSHHSPLNVNAIRF